MTRPLIAPLPCGCVADPERITFRRARKGVKGASLSCPWCAAVFTVAFYSDWLNERERNVVVQAPVQVMESRNRVFEIVGVCDCGAPMIRVPCMKSVSHLGATAPMKLLRN